MAPTRIVALPGTLCPPAVFDRLTGTLGSTADVEVIDWLAGSGPWDVPGVAARVTDEIERAGSPVVLCGHSTGGAVALRIAVDRPELLDGLVLIDTGAHMRGHGDVAAIIERVRTGWGEDLRASVLDRSFAEPLDPALRRTWLDWSSTVPMRAVHEVLTSQAALDLTPELAAVAVPTLVVHGTSDRSRSVDDARALAAGIPDARLRLLPTGHSPMHEAPEQVAAEIRDLLGQLGRQKNVGCRDT